MSLDEKKLGTSIDSEFEQFSPSTNTNTVTHSNGETLDAILEHTVPIRISREEFNEKIKNGEITENSDTLYEVYDEPESGGIVDGKITEHTTFSSKKIVEMIATLGSGGTIILGDGSGKSDKITIDLSPTKWVGTGPYTQTVSSDNISDDNIIIVELSDSLNDDDYDAQFKMNTLAKIKRISHSGNTLTFKAYGKKPEGHIIIDAIIQK